MSQAAAIGAELRALVAQACIALVLEINRELIKATPVDTGHARANWVPSIGQPTIGEFGSSGEQQQGLARVLSFKLADGVLYISNGVPYIQRLNAGHSTQAPSLFVEAAVDRAYATIQARYASKGIDLGRGGFQSQIGGEGAGNLASAYSPFGGN